MIALAAAAATQRSSGNFDPAVNWTWFLRFKQGVTTPAGAFFRNYFVFGDPTFTNPYVYFGSLAASDDLLVRAWDGASAFDTPAFTPTPSAQAWAAVTYTSATHALTLIVNGVTIGSITVNLSTVTFVETQQSIGFTVALKAFGDFSVAYARQWQAVLSSAELTTEAASLTAVRTTSLLSDTPLQASIDLTAHNNTLTQWTATGTVTTDTTDPLLAVIAAPPTNTAANLAVVATPTSAIFQDARTGGLAADVWFQYTPTAQAKVASFIGFPNGGTYSPNVQIWDNLTDALTGNVALAVIQSLSKCGVQIQVDPLKTYYIRAHAAAAVSPATLEFSILENLALLVPIGSYAINDDDETLDFPLVLMDRTTGYPINVVNSFAKGEGAAILSDGTLLCTNEHVADEVQLYNGTYQLQTTVAMPQASGAHASGAAGPAGPRCIASNGTSKFLVGQPYNRNLLRLMILNSAAAILQTWDLAAVNIFLTAIGVLPDFSKAYVALTDSANRPIKAVDLATGLYLADLDPGVATYGAGRDILALDPNIILVPYYKATSVIVRKYDATGSVLGTLNLDVYAGGSDILDVRLCRFTDDDSFVVWVKGTLQGRDYLIRVNTTTLAVIEATPNLDEYESGQYIATSSATPQRFGHSESCPFWVTRLPYAGAPVPPPTPPATRRRIRRVRRFPLPFDRNFWVYVRRIEFLIQAGVGNANDPGADPQLEVRFSGDGGNTWGNIILVPMGKQGEYNLRQVINNVGKLRNGWVEVADSDPVRSYLLACFVDAEENES